MILSKNDLISELHFSMRKVILAWKTAHLFMKKVERQGEKVGYEICTYQGAQSPSVCQPKPIKVSGLEVGNSAMPFKMGRTYF